jgi:Zn-dependent alcohol dehydrogenase
MLRDIPRYVKLIEKGLIAMKSMITATYPINEPSRQYRLLETVQNWGR